MSRLFMTSPRPFRRFVFLFGIGWLIGVADARAQSHLDVQKRSFARLLARRERAREAAEHTEAAAARHAGAPRFARSALSLFAGAKRSSSAFIDGLSAATPVTPSGFGVGRDAFVETFYFETFGREISQAELDRISGAIAHGAHPMTVASALWDSPEHRALVKSHSAPAFTFAEAYRNALAACLAARRRKWPHLFG
jgi:hypothetical protein